MKDILQVVITAILLLALVALGFIIGINTTVVEERIIKEPVIILECQKTFS